MADAIRETVSSAGSEEDDFRSSPEDENSSTPPQQGPYPMMPINIQPTPSVSSTASLQGPSSQQPSPNSTQTTSHFQNFLTRNRSPSRTLLLNQAMNLTISTPPFPTTGPDAPIPRTARRPQPPQTYTLSPGSLVPQEQLPEPTWLPNLSPSPTPRNHTAQQRPWFSSSTTVDIPHDGPAPQQHHNPPSSWNWPSAPHPSRATARYSTGVPQPEQLGSTNVFTRNPVRNSLPLQQQQQQQRPTPQQRNLLQNSNTTMAPHHGPAQQTRAPPPERALDSDIVPRRPTRNIPPGQLQGVHPAQTLYNANRFLPNTPFPQNHPPSRSTILNTVMPAHPPRAEPLLQPPPAPRLHSQRLPHSTPSSQPPPNPTIPAYAPIYPVANRESWSPPQPTPETGAAAWSEPWRVEGHWHDGDDYAVDDDDDDDDDEDEDFGDAAAVRERRRREREWEELLIREVAPGRRLQNADDGMGGWGVSRERLDE